MNSLYIFVKIVLKSTETKTVLTIEIKTIDVKMKMKNLRFNLVNATV